jgi:hypothetical protein
VSFDSPPEIVPPTTLPSPLQHAAAVPDAAPTGRPASRIARTRRALVRQAGMALGFDAAILAAMVALAWVLFMPWSRALDAADGLMAIGLIVCGGLWTAFVQQDLRRWRRLRRSLRR